MFSQFDLTTIFCAKPQQFAWFIGAGASAQSGLPTASDIIWELKRGFYCRAENQEISRQDIQIDAIRNRIQSFVESRGFPKEGDPSEYTIYFEKIFGSDKERQRQYLQRILSEDKVSLTIGNRILAAYLGTGRAHAVFSTNFDSVIERAVSEVSGRSLSAYHLEGSASATKALSNDEFPFYCKLHGDFRYDSVKNLQADLERQNEELSKAFLTATNRFGFIVAGYSGRDQSVMALFRKVLSTTNPFPHGLFWTGLKNRKPLPAVIELIRHAQQAGIVAHYLEVETFDAFMLRLWRNTNDKEAEVDAKVRRSQLSVVAIPLPEPGTGQIMRMNALPLSSLPGLCQAVSFKENKEWRDLRTATIATKGKLIFTKSDTVLCWGSEALIRGHFNDVLAISSHDLSVQIGDIERHLHVKGFLEEAVVHALGRDKPLLARTTRSGSYLIVDANSDDRATLAPLSKTVGKPTGQIAGRFTEVDDDHPHPERIYWAEAVRVSLEIVAGRSWLVIDPNIWIWPTRARKNMTDFLDMRRSGRYNKIYNTILDAWLKVLFDAGRNIEFTVSAFDKGSLAENPSFKFGSRTAYSRRLFQ